MNKLLSLLPDGWSINVESFGDLGSSFELYELGRCVLTCYDLDSFVKHCFVAFRKAGVCRA